MYIPLKYYVSNDYKPAKKLSGGLVPVHRSFAAFINYFIFLILNNNLDGHIESDENKFTSS